jgi:hypothetical protein
MNEHIRTLLMDSMRDDPGVADVYEVCVAETAYGWDVLPLTQAGTAQARIDPFVRKLRAQYDLKTD